MEHEPIESTAVRLPENVVEEAFQVRMAIGDPNAASSLPPEPLVEDERLVKIFVKIRDAKRAYNDAYKAELESKYDAPLRQISTELKKRLQSRTNEGLKTSYGTVYLAEEMKVSCQDWGIFYDWIKKNDGLEFLEQRVKAGEVKNYMTSHNGELPPGLSVFRETEARVRKPKTPSSNVGQAPDPASE